MPNKVHTFSKPNPRLCLSRSKDPLDLRRQRHSMELHMVAIRHAGFPRAHGKFTTQLNLFNRWSSFHVSPQKTHNHTLCTKYVPLTMSPAILYFVTTISWAGVGSWSSESAIFPSNVAHNAFWGRETWRLSTLGLIAQSRRHIHPI